MYALTDIPKMYITQDKLIVHKPFSGMLYCLLCWALVQTPRGQQGQPVLEERTL